ncbi:MAG: hypothetical protein KGN79_05415 [Acidobacteriota bacterium]|nr:hypothetical protein [Acidobacteriota bacterium]
MAAENSSAKQQGLESSEEVQQSNATSPETLAIQASEQTLDHGTDETAPAPAVPQVVVSTPELVLAPVPTPVVKPEVPVFEAAIPVAPRPALQKAPVKSSRSAKPAGPSGFQRIVSMARTVLPIAEKLLPLLDGNVATAAANVFAPRPTPKPVDLTPLERSIDKLKGGHADLQVQLAEQSTHLRKVATQVKTLEETAHKLQSERDDLEEDVLTLRKRLSVVSRVAFTLIGLLVAADAYFILHNLRILP